MELWCVQQHSNASNKQDEGDERQRRWGHLYWRWCMIVEKAGGNNKLKQKGLLPRLERNDGHALGFLGSKNEDQSHLWGLTQPAAQP